MGFNTSFHFHKTHTMYLKRTLILFVLLLSLGFSCTQDDVNPQLEEQGARFEEHTLHSVPGLANF